MRTTPNSSVRLALTVLLFGAVLLGGSGFRSERNGVVRCDDGDNLQDAIDGARPRSELTVRGTCIGNFTISHDLRLRGIEGGTLQGPFEGTILTIEAGTNVALRDLVITEGRPNLDVPESRRVGGIYNKGDLALEGTTSVVNNTDYSCGLNPPPRSPCDPEFPFGDGISRTGGIINDGTLVLRDGAAVSGNFGGVLNRGTMFMQDRASITNNIALNGAGVGNAGSLTLEDRATIRGNRARNTVAGVAGGVSNSGLLTLNDRATITENFAGQNGGGVSNGGTVVLNDRASIVNNTARHIGGGIYNSGTVVLNDRYRISGNTAQDGGGIMNRGNLATIMGSLDGVSGNTPNQCVSYGEATGC